MIWLNSDLPIRSTSIVEWSRMITNDRRHALFPCLMSPQLFGALKTTEIESRRRALGAFRMQPRVNIHWPHFFSSGMIHALRWTIITRNFLIEFGNRPFTRTSHRMKMKMLGIVWHLLTRWTGKIHALGILSSLTEPRQRIRHRELIDRTCHRDEKVHAWCLVSSGTNWEKAPLHLEHWRSLDVSGMLGHWGSHDCASVWEGLKIWNAYTEWATEHARDSNNTWSFEKLHYHGNVACMNEKICHESWRTDQRLVFSFTGNRIPYH